MKSGGPQKLYLARRNDCKTAGGRRTHLRAADKSHVRFDIQPNSTIPPIRGRTSDRLNSFHFFFISGVCTPIRTIGHTGDRTAVRRWTVGSAVYGRRLNWIYAMCVSEPLVVGAGRRH